MADPNAQMAGEDNYADASMPDAVKPAEANPAEAKSDEGIGETALVPKSICPDMNPGDELTLRVTRVMDDQYEVAYAPKKEDEGAEPAPPEAAPGPGGGEMKSLYD